MAELKGIKQILISGMDKLMLNCDHATLAIDQSEFERPKCFKRMQLKMHLKACSLCREYLVQSKIINNHLKVMGTIQADELTWKLSVDQKKVISKNIEEQISKK